nr:protease modulator HflC [Lachnospiraceae bacterium]
MEEKKKKLSFGWIVVLVILVLMVLRSALVVTYADEYKVITQFGSIVRVEKNPGPSFKIPIIQNTVTIPKKKLLYDLPPSDVTTKDKKVMTVDSFIIWEVTDPIKYMESVNASQEKAEVRIGNVVYNAVKTVMSATTQEDIISGRNGKLVESILGAVGHQMDSYGIVIEDVETKKLDLPESNEASVYQRMISERNNIAAQYTADGDYKYSLIINETDRTVRQTKATAAAEAEKIKAEGEAEYMKILSKAYNDEAKADFYNYVRSLDALKGSLNGKGDKTIVL